MPKAQPITISWNINTVIEIPVHQESELLVREKKIHQGPSDLYRLYGECSFSVHTECIVANTEVECVQYKFTGFITNIFQYSGELCLEVKLDSSYCTIHISQTLTG